MENTLTIGRYRRDRGLVIGRYLKAWPGQLGSVRSDRLFNAQVVNEGVMIIK